ncbi:MAG: DUF3570 domain-containing protein [Pseudomonadota bacterium]
MNSHRLSFRFCGIALLAVLASDWLHAAVLPEDRADVLYHRYEGDNITIEGPSVLLRKQIGKSVSVSANYYVDMITSASIDVVTTASPYTEERTQTSLGVDYLRGGTMMSVGVTQSDESDFEARTYSFAVYQNLFGDLTTVTLAYGLGDDVVGQSGDPTFARDVQRQSYGVGISQILTRNLIMTLNFEGITDEGFLNNPYRSVRFLNDDGLSYSLQSEVYPNTRTSAAVSLGGRYYLPYRAAVNAEYRYFSDTWGITANSFEIGYTHPWRDKFTFSTRYRHYTQEQADFYSDLFPRVDFQNFLARDKELSTFTSQAIRAGVAYDFGREGMGPLDRGRVSFFWDYLFIDYENFNDLRVTDVLPGDEPQFSLDANVIQLFISFWY